MVGFPFLREAFLFGIVLYIWGMGLREQTQQDTANAMQKPYGYDVLIAMKRELEAKRPMVGTEEYSTILAIDYELRCMEQGAPVHHSSKAWWDGVHEMD